MPRVKKGKHGRHHIVVHTCIFAKYSWFSQILAVTYSKVNLLKVVTEDVTIPPASFYTTLWNIASTKSMATADQACTYWRECDCGRWAKKTCIVSCSVIYFVNVTVFGLTWFCFQGDLSDHFAKFVTTISGVKQLKPLTNGQMKILRNIILVSTAWLTKILLFKSYYYENFRETDLVLLKLFN